MATLLDYLFWRGDLTLAQAGWNEVDAMVLARLSYLPFDTLAMAAQSMEVGKAVSLLLDTPEIENAVIMKEDLDFMCALASSARYSGMRLSRYVNQFDADSQTQFAAITIQLDENLDYVSFRGTDNTLIGWKENFNMGFLFPVPAQESAVAYLEALPARPRRRIIVGGHSKGGNLALYAATFCSAKTQDAIQMIYNFDGPGFQESVVALPAYQRIRDRMITYLPQSSIVGMLLEHQERHIVVKSLEKTGYLQHDIYTWAVDRNHFVYLDRVTDGSRFLDQTLRGWLADMVPTQRERFVDALYSVIAQTQMRTLQDMEDNWFECTVAILSSLGSIDDQTWKLIVQCMSLFFSNVKKSAGQWGALMDEAPKERRLPSAPSAQMDVNHSDEQELNA